MPGGVISAALCCPWTPAAAPGWCRSGFVAAACGCLEYPNISNASTSNRTGLTHEPRPYISIRVDGDVGNNNY